MFMLCTHLIIGLVGRASLSVKMSLTAVNIPFAANGTIRIKKKPSLVTCLAEMVNYLKTAREREFKPNYLPSVCSPTHIHY